jgi:NAD(P)-dependent dehydrogenase (short-subunit alcohol dehydrogenase family)
MKPDALFKRSTGRNLFTKGVIMPLYRAKAGDGVVWITGASSGIGRELALAMARRGYVVAATARGADALEALARESKGMSGAIRAFAGDVTDAEAMAGTVSDIERHLGPLRLAVFNAGVYIPTHGEALDLADFEKTIDINLLGALKGLVPTVERMKANGCGQVVFVASVSGYSGLPAASAYGATKAAIINMAESLSFDFDKMNIRTQVVNPGFVDTPATQKNDFDMPALVSAEKAVSQIIHGIEQGGFEITFPRHFTYMLKLLRLLPHPLYFWIMKRQTGWGTRPLDHRNTTPASVTRIG